MLFKKINIKYYNNIKYKQILVNKLEIRKNKFYTIYNLGPLFKVIIILNCSFFLSANSVRLRFC